MELKLTKGRTVLFLITLFLTNVALMADMVIIPAADGLFSTFDNVGLVNFILSGPAFISIFSAILCGKLMEHFNKKVLLTFGFALFTVGAVFGGAAESIYYVLAMRCLVGVAMGFVNAAAMALIAEVYVEEGKRSTIMGIFNASMAGVGAVIGLIAGYFAVDSWRSVFKVYWVAVPILVLVILFIPSINKKQEEETTGEKKAGSGDTGYLVHFVPFILACIAVNMIYMVVYYQIALYVSEAGIGNESVAGVLSSLGTVGSCLACLAFGATYSKLKRSAVIPSYALLFLTYAVLLLTKNVVAAGIACTLMGAAYGNAFSYYFMRGTVIVPPQKADFAMGIITAAGGFGMFISTYMVTGLQKIMGITTVTGTIPVWMVLSAVGAVLAAVLAVRDRTKPSEYRTEN